MPSRVRTIIPEDKFQQSAADGLETLYEVAKAAYGPKAGVAWIENTYGDPLVSRDGVTNLDNVYLEDPVANMVARGAIQASKQSNRQVGDGTTAVIILTYHLYKAARKLIAGGYNRMEVEARLTGLVELVETYVDKIKVEVTPEILAGVARISCGNQVMGDLIAEVVKDIGPDGGISIQDYPGYGVWPEVTDGFYWPKGYSSVQLINDPAALESRFTDVAILISEKRLATSSDIAPILDSIVGAGIKDLVIVGEVEQEAMAVLATLRVQGMLTATPVDVPAFAGNRSLMLSDLALVTGGSVLLPGVGSKDFRPEILGTASKVVITGNSTSIIGREGNSEDIQSRVAELTTQFDESEVSTDREAIRERIGRLKGQMAIIHVGGATEVEQRETKLRVQDAVCALQAATRSGVVPGGGVTLAGARTDDGNFNDALDSPFKDLVANTGYNPEAKLGKLDLDAQPWFGFDLKHMTDEPDDLLALGIVDPAEVTKETIRNAVSVVSKIITGTVAITYTDRSVRHE